MGEMTPAREKAKQLIDRIPNRDINSLGPDQKLFEEMTGTLHSVMKANWTEKNGIMTACNGWTGTYSTKIGRGGLGVFDLASVAGGAWVPCDGVAQPQFGDVFRCKKLHVGVVLECYGNEALVIEAGQGGKSTGYDILRRSRKPWGVGEIMGWVNIDIWLDPAELEKEKLRKSLKGTWTVEVNGQKRAYTFPSAGSDVSYLDKGRKVTGKWSTEGPNVAIKWSNGESEIWPMPIPPLYKVAQGTFKDPFNRTAPITYRHAW